jgi:hypothetical protein
MSTTTSSGDGVDRIVGAWRHERPDLDVTPLAVLSRVSRLARRLDLARGEAFAEQDLEGWEFDVLSALRRTTAGAFGLDGAVTFEALKAAPRGGLRDQVRPLETLLSELPAVPLSVDLAARVCHGQTVQSPGPAVSPGATVRLLSPDGRLLAVAAAVPQGPGLSLQPLVVLG